MDEKMFLKEIVRLFTEDKSLREYCGITDPEADMCRKVLIDDKLFNELAIPGKIERSQVKKMAFAPFLKVINKVSRQIDHAGFPVKETTDYNINIPEAVHTYINEELESITIDNINISERTRKVLAENGITSIDEIAELNFDQLKLKGNYGVKTIFELQQLAGKLKDSRDILSILRKNGK